MRFIVQELARLETGVSRGGRKPFLTGYGSCRYDGTKAGGDMSSKKDRV